MQTPAVAGDLFGADVDTASAYAYLLASRGVEWGLIGPREVDRIWERHVLNSVAVSALVPEDATVVDVGSGAGLPGIPLAIARPDLRVTLLEPLQRRATFLVEVVDELGLGDRVRVIRGRASQASDQDPLVHRGRYDVVTSRAVAALPKLVQWCEPLMEPDGRIVALKGSSAAREVEESRGALRKRGLVADVHPERAYPDAEPTWLVLCRRARR
jgi:16S rRNA (guanine527-N7)-methyltransferase